MASIKEGAIVTHKDNPMKTMLLVKIDGNRGTCKHHGKEKYETHPLDELTPHDNRPAKVFF